MVFLLDIFKFPISQKILDRPIMLHFFPFQLLENVVPWHRIHMDVTDCCGLRVNLRVPYVDTQLLAEERSALLGSENILWFY